MILGIDTHLVDVHVAVALDGLGRRLGELNVPTTVKGYQKLLRWAEGFAVPYALCRCMEGTGRAMGLWSGSLLEGCGDLGVMEVERGPSALI